MIVDTLPILSDLLIPGARFTTPILSSDMVVVVKSNFQDPDPWKFVAPFDVSQPAAVARHKPRWPSRHSAAGLQCAPRARGSRYSLSSRARLSRALQGPLWALFILSMVFAALCVILVERCSPFR